MRKFLSMLVILTMVTMLAVGCSKGNTDKSAVANKDTTESSSVKETTKSDEKTKIVYMQFSAGDTNTETLQSMVDEFQKEYPNIEVEVQSLAYDDYFTALATKLTGNSGPDCFELNMENFLTYAIRDTVEPLDGYLAKSEVDLSTVNKGVLAAATYNDKLFAIPQSYSTVVLFYNKALFDQAGIPYPTDDWTWKDEQKAAEAIKALGDDIWGTSQPVTYHELYKTVKTNGGSLVNADGTEFTLDTPENIAALDMMLNRVRGDKRVMPNAEDMAGRGDWDMFKSGNLGMIHTGIWAFQDFTDNADFDWDIVLEPGNITKATHFFANVAAINPNSDKKDAAFKFITYMAANAGCVQKRLDAKWELPVVDDETIMSQYLKLDKPANRQAVLNSLTYAVAPPALVNYSEVSEIINVALEAAASNNTSAADVLKSIQAELVSKDLAN